MNSFFQLDFKDKSNLQIKNQAKRLLVISFLMATAGLVIMMRIIELSLPDKEVNANKHETRIETLNTSRGLLIDRNNRILASNIYIYNLKAYPKKIKDPIKTLSLLKKEITLNNSDQVLEKIKDKKKYEILIKKNIIAPKAKKINNLGIPGLEFVPTIKRFYPHKDLAAHYIGHVNDNMKGQMGAERTFNQLLGSGNDVKLGIDIRVQYAVRDELKKAFSKYNTKSATAIITDINNGEILSLVSLPDFNPNKSIDPKHLSYTNTATINLYEMGSTFKIFTIAAAIENRKIDLKSKFDATKPIEISNHIIKDYKPQNKFLSTSEIFLKSSNIGASQIAWILGEKKLKKFYNQLGLLAISKVNLYEKTKPIIPKKWGKVETATLSFGHGVSISPMQMIEAASKLFRNDKNYIADIEYNASNKNYRREELISSSTLNILKKLMYENTITGTAKKAKLKGYYIGGKTATGEKAINGKYNKTKIVSSFLAVFPINEPKYISLILLDEPTLKNSKEGATGGSTAAPVTAEIFKRIFPILGINKNLEREPSLFVKNKGKLNFVSY
ncbi:MAG: hypothetical protein CMP36_03555 [Rickettsiales bacterium]|nr:hypothetical protein [Rickettsiales bacterium]OUV78996.1 MAG: hypothetical protein CBC91_04325 [Rickettsiales bacterium TMED131]